MTENHVKFLLKAHKIASRNFGKTFPNPSVGCVIVKNGKIISQAVTGSMGRPHAEELALSKAKDKAFGATMYVTLEPCNHNSINGSCSDQIIRSRIKNIFIAKLDPDPRTKGASIKKLKNNKIKTSLGITSEKTYNLNKFFFESLKLKRPFIKVKMAVSNDNKIAWSDYSSKWISNSQSRSYAHLLRYQSQAILSTSKTILKDNPRFTIRKKNKIIKYLPVIIIDKHLKIPINCSLIKSLSKRRVIIFCSKKNNKYKKLKLLGCELFFIKNLNSKNNYKLSLIMKKILSLNINNILVEAGGIFFSNLLKEKLVDEIHLFKASFEIGNKGKPMISDKELNFSSFKEISKKKFKKDIYQLFSNKI